jgi:hypothetical protein
MTFLYERMTNDETQLHVWSSGFCMTSTYILLPHGHEANPNSNVQVEDDGTLKTEHDMQCVP